MGKKDKKLNQADKDAVVEKRSGPEGGVQFEATEHTIEDTVRQTGLQHISKPWSRHSWERAAPWILGQRQKLEGNGWTTGEAIRTELFVLKRTAPGGTYTEDGWVYLRVPKKMIDFFRTAKKHNTDDDNESVVGDDIAAKKRSVSSRASKKREQRCQYDLSDPNVWHIKIDGADAEDPTKEATVMIDASEAMENIFNLVMCLQPGLVRLHAWRENVVQAGTHEVDERLDADPPTARHRAQIAESEYYTRVLPPPYWFKRNRDDLEKILGQNEFEATLRAAENSQRCTTRLVKNVEDKVWEEVLRIDPQVQKMQKKALRKKAKAAAAADGNDANNHNGMTANPHVAAAA